MADNKVYHKINDLNIELYTTKKDLVTEAKLEKVWTIMRYLMTRMGHLLNLKNVSKIYETRLI